MMASAAVAVRVVAVLAIPPRPVAVLAAVIFVLVDHAALPRSLECNRLFVAAASLLNPRRFAAAIGAPCQSVSKYLAPSIPAPKNGEATTPTETYSGT